LQRNTRSSVVAFRLALDRRALKSARESVEERIADLRATGRAGPSLYAQFVEKQDQLLTMETLLTRRVELVRRAPQAGQLPTHLVYTSGTQTRPDHPRSGKMRLSAFLLARRVTSGQSAEKRKIELRVISVIFYVEPKAPLSM
jgi:hypothetical protein